MGNIEQFNREQVLEKAVEVFSKNGYNGTSMQDLVAATGLNRSSIYNSFGSKLSLYFNALTYYKQKSGIDSSISNSQSLNGLEKIKKIFSFYLIDILKDKNNVGCMIMNCKSEMASTNGEVVKWILQNTNETLKILQDFIWEGQEQGVINTRQTPKNYALYLLSSLEGLRTTGILNKNKEELEVIVSAIISAIR